jgi:hypothetical protein
MISMEQAEMSEDVLDALKRELAEHRAAEKAAAVSARELEVAIAAIERSRSKPTSRSSRQNPVKRGQLSTALIALIAEGRGWRATMERDLKAMGLPTNGNSISNALNRLMRKGEIGYDGKRYVPHNTSENRRSISSHQNAEGLAC